MSRGTNHGGRWPGFKFAMQFLTVLCTSSRLEGSETSSTDWAQSLEAI